MLGLSDGMVLAVVASNSLWPVLLATVHGFASVEPRLYEVARALQLSRAATVARIALPSAGPDILVDMPLGLTVALILAVICEMLAAREGLCSSLAPVLMCSNLGIICRLARIGEAAEVLGVSISTLRCWEASGRLIADRVGTHRQYDFAKLRPEQFRISGKVARSTIAYARVSSHDQKADLERQKQALELHCARQGWTCEVIADLGRA